MPPNQSNNKNNNNNNRERRQHDNKQLSLSLLLPFVTPCWISLPPSHTHTHTHRHTHTHTHTHTLPPSSPRIFLSITAQINQQLPASVWQFSPSWPASKSDVLDTSSLSCLSDSLSLSVCLSALSHMAVRCHCKSFVFMLHSNGMLVFFCSLCVNLNLHGDDDVSSRCDRGSNERNQDTRQR